MAPALGFKFMESRCRVSLLTNNHSSHTENHAAGFGERFDSVSDRDSKQQTRRATLLDHKWLLSSVS